MMTSPLFLGHTLKAQQALSRAQRMDDSAGIEAQYKIADMLDMLGEHINADKEASNE